LIAPLAAFAIAGPYYFNRPFWSDEVLSWLIASDPSFDHGMAALAGGVDTNAPLVHLLFRLLGLAFGTAPIVYRLASLIAMAATIVGLYLTLRRSVKASAAAFGCLCFAALPIVISHTTEARFYAFELAAAVWTNLLIARRVGGKGVPPAGFADLQSHHGRDARAVTLSTACLALTSIALCGVHYFGVIALGCIVFADIFRERTTIAAWLDRVWPTSAGLAMTACLLPLVIAQRTAMRDAGGTWVPDTFVKNLRATVDMLFPPEATWIVVVFVLVSVVVAGRAQIIAAVRDHRAIFAAATGYVLVMLTFDRLVQPVFVPRYFVIALPAVAAMAAAFASRWPMMITRAAIVLVAICLCAQWWQIRARSHAPDGRAAAGLLASVAAVDAGTPIFSDWLGHAIPIIQARPAIGANVSYVADKRLREAGFDSAIRYEREMAACVQRFYGLPNQTDLSRMNQLDRFVLLTEFPESIGERFPDYDARKLGTVAFELTRSSQHADRSAAGSDRSANAD
jgi:mannosyltransferase